MEREDIQTMKALDSAYPVSQLAFSSLMELLISFCDKILLSEPLSRSRTLLHHAQSFSAGSISAAQLEVSRTQAWQWYDQSAESGEEKKLLRIVICCLYDEEAAEFSTYGGEAVMEAFLSSLLDLGDGYCTGFLKHAKDHFKTLPHE